MPLLIVSFKNTYYPIYLKYKNEANRKSKALFDKYIL